MDAKKLEQISMPRNKRLYKFLYKGLASSYGDFKWEIGNWYKEENIKICDRGFHASKNPAHAFSYVQGEVLAKVEVKGEKVVEGDKECWSEMRIVKAWKWGEKDYISFAIFAAEQAIGIYEKEYPNDERPRNAIEAAKKYSENPTKENQDAASYAAAHASSCASYAAYSASYAAHADLWNRLGGWIEKRIDSLEEIKSR